MTLLIRPEPFAQEFDRLFSSLFDNTRNGGDRPALGAPDGPGRVR